MGASDFSLSSEKNEADSQVGSRDRPPTKKARTTLEKRIEQRWPKANTYEAPGLSIPYYVKKHPIRGYRMRKSVGTKDFQYEKQLPLPQQLVGEYDLIFFLHPHVDEGVGVKAQHRVVKGTMECSLVSASASLEEEKELLSVSLRIPTEERTFLHFLNFVDFDLSSTIQLDENGIASREKCLQETSDFQATLKVLSEPNAVRYMPEYHIYDGSQVQRKYRKSIQYRSIEESRNLLVQYKSTPLQWLCTHIDMPDDVSSLIQQYATFRPPPVFIFETGDLVLSVKVSDIIYGETNPIFIARRCKT